MTNFEKIKSMSIEEMAEFLSDGWDCNDCEEFENLSDHPLLKHTKCSEKCAEHCIEWLESEASES